MLENRDPSARAGDVGRVPSRKHHVITLTSAAVATMGTHLLPWFAWAPFSVAWGLTKRSFVAVSDAATSHPAAFRPREPVTSSSASVPLLALRQASP